MGVNTYYLELIFILLNIFQPQKLMNKTMKAEKLFLRTNDKKHQKKNLVANLLELIQVKGCRINAERGYNTDYEVSKIQILISKFKDKKIKELEGKIKKIKL